MTKEKGLVKVKQMMVGKEKVQTADARELWKFLESKQRFADWVRNRIEKYGFSEGRDYFIILRNRSGDTTGKPLTDYHLTLDMAKELAMVERTEKGKQARLYFIEVEKRFRQLGGESQAKPKAIPSSTVEERKGLNAAVKEYVNMARSNDRIYERCARSVTMGTMGNIGLGDEGAPPVGRRQDSGFFVFL